MKLTEWEKKAEEKKFSELNKTVQSLKIIKETFPEIISEFEGLNTLTEMFEIILRYKKENN